MKLKTWRKFRDHSKMNVHKVYSPDEILPLISTDREKKLIDGYRVNCCSLRLRTFKKSLTCRYCGRKGTEFRLENQIYNPSSPNPHLNLYSADNILMTHDHMVPLYSGGEDRTANTTTCCHICNFLKAHKPLEEFVCFLDK